MAIPIAYRARLPKAQFIVDLHQNLKIEHKYMINLPRPRYYAKREK